MSEWVSKPPDLLYYEYTSITTEQHSNNGLAMESIRLLQHTVPLNTPITILDSNVNQHPLSKLCSIAFSITFLEFLLLNLFFPHHHIFLCREINSLIFVIQTNFPISRSVCILFLLDISFYYSGNKTSIQKNKNKHMWLFGVPLVWKLTPGLDIGYVPQKVTDTNKWACKGRSASSASEASLSWARLLVRYDYYNFSLL